MQISTTGIILKETTVNEDKYVHILSEDMGVISVFVKGAKNLKGKLVGVCELFCYNRFILFSYKDNYTLNSAECIEAFFDLRKDLDNLSLASYISELALELAPKEEPAHEMLHLVLNTLHLIRKGDKPHSLIKPAAELRALALVGFMPNLSSCVKCDDPLEEKDCFFYPADGIVRCERCKMSKEAGGGEELFLPSPILAAMRYILYCDPKRVFSFTLGVDGLKYLEEIIEKYLITQTGRNYKTLNFYKSIKGI